MKTGETMERRQDEYWEGTNGTGEIKTDISGKSMLKLLPNCEALQLHHGDDDDNGEYSLGVGLYFGATGPECLGKKIEHKQNTGRYTVYAVCECGAIQADQLAAFQTSYASACKNNLFN